MTVAKGSWVSLRKVILEPEERAAGIPEETAKTPLVMWLSGFLLEDAQIGEEARVRTKMNREETGILEELNPSTKVDYGDFVPEIQQIGIQARKMLL